MSSIFDWFTTNTDTTQTADQAAANIATLQSQATALQQQKLADGSISQLQYDQSVAAINGDSFQDPGTAAASTFWQSLNPFASDPNNPSTGIGALLKDLLVLAAIGGAIYLFVKLGGISKLKKLAS